MLAETVCTATRVLEREILTVPQLLMYSKGVKCYSKIIHIILYENWNAYIIYNLSRDERQEEKKTKIKNH